VSTLSEIRAAWGGDHFVKCAPALLSKLELQDGDYHTLSQLGLPLGPASALAFRLRFENVKVVHQPGQLRFLSETPSFEKPPDYPSTGDPESASWARLDRFVVLGEVPTDQEMESGSFAENRFICLDSGSGRVAWVYPRPTDGSTACFTINRNLTSYLNSLLAYKRFRDQLPALELVYHKAGGSTRDPHYQAFAKRIHAELLKELEAADPRSFMTFWEGHATNEAILLEI
jgi:hypothetical protein